MTNVMPKMALAFLALALFCHVRKPFNIVMSLKKSIRSGSF